MHNLQFISIGPKFHSWGCSFLNISKSWLEVWLDNLRSTQEKLFPQSVETGDKVFSFIFSKFHCLNIPLILMNDLPTYWFCPNLILKVPRWNTWEFKKLSGDFREYVCIFSFLSRGSMVFTSISHEFVIQKKHKMNLFFKSSINFIVKIVIRYKCITKIIFFWF